MTSEHVTLHWRKCKSVDFFFEHEHLLHSQCTYSIFASYIGAHGDDQVSHAHPYILRLGEKVHLFQPPDAASNSGQWVEMQAVIWAVEQASSGKVRRYLYGMHHGQCHGNNEQFRLQDCRDETCLMVCHGNNDLHACGFLYREGAHYCSL